MDNAPRMPTRTWQTATQQVDSHPAAGNAEANAARNDMAGPVPQAAGRLGRAIQVEIGQAGNMAAGRRPLRITINEAANTTFTIPTRKETLVDMLTRVGLELSQAMEQNLTNSVFYISRQHHY